jgi:N-methylhydantoinase A
MAQGIREVTIKRGFDPREFPVIPAGGAGPIHACLIAQELEIPLQLVPREASVLCAFGMLMCELKHDFVRTFVTRLDSADWKRLAAVVGEMADEGERQLEHEGVPRERRSCEVTLDCRYVRQYHEVSVPVPRAAIASGDAGVIARAFHDEHHRLYGYSLEREGSPVEIINVRVQTIGQTDKPASRAEPWAGADSAAAIKSRRAVYLPETRAFEQVPVYAGDRMSHGNRVDGPALIELETTAIFVGASFDCVVDALGSFVLFAKGREDLVASCIRAEEATA